MKKYLAHPALLALLALSSTHALAGTISGEISFAKKPPQFAVIYVDDGSQVNTQVLNQKDKEFSAPVVVGSQGGKVSLKNGDQVEHNIYSNDASSGVNFDVGLMSPGSSKEINVTWENDQLVRVGCKIHPKMRSYIATISSKHYQEFEFDRSKNRFEVNIENVPDSAKTVKMMLPKYDPIEVQLAPGAQLEIPITRKGAVKGSLTLTR